MDNGEAAYRLFHKRYDVRIPAYQLISKAEMDLIGVPNCGDKQLDRELQRSLRPARLTPIGLALLFEEGASIMFTVQEAAAEVFEDILTHLANWDNMLKTSYNCVPPPIEDLDILVNFSKGLEAYSHHINKTMNPGFALSKTMLRFEESNFGLAQMPARRRVSISDTQPTKSRMKDFGFTSFEELRASQNKDGGF